LKQNLGKWIPVLVGVSGYGVVAIILTVFSAIPWTFAYLEVGIFIGPIPVLEYFILILFAAAISLVSFLASMKLKKNRAIWMFILNLIMSLVISSLVIFSFSLVFIPQVSQAGKKIDIFIAENANSSFQDYVTNVSSFLNDNLGAAYDKPEASFRIDNFISCTLLDPYIMQIWGVTRTDLIVYQRWGTCEQSALLIGELLQRAGYETRQAFFKNIDHQWAEVKYNGTWLIVDPWYIGNFVEAQNLKNVKPEFQQASGVGVQYSNGTRIDASYEHGY
jgi:hypothetical protein